MLRTAISGTGLASLAAAALVLAAPPSGAQAADGAPARRVAISLRLPVDAEVWFENSKTAQTGTARAFVSPPLTPGQDYVYTLRVRWKDGTGQVEHSRTLRVRAGDTIALEFSAQGVVEARGYADAPPTPVPTPAYRSVPALERGESPAHVAPFSEQSPGRGSGPPGSNSPLSQGMGNG
jgi:uncharacterized protein (TIGR03000 family)